MMTRVHLARAWLGCRYYTILVDSTLPCCR
jgi:hypothetical protein